MKIIITISLWLAVWLAAPPARADAKDDLCESHQLGLRAVDALEKSSGAQKVLYAMAMGKLSDAQKLLLGTVLMGYHRRLCPEAAGKESLARNRWNRLSKSDKCTMASVWNEIMVHMYVSFLNADNSAGFYVPRTILHDFASAANASRRALVASGCQ